MRKRRIFKKWNRRFLLFVSANLRNHYPPAFVKRFLTLYFDQPLPWKSRKGHRR